MQAHPQITALTITAATLIAQFAIIFIVFIAALILKSTYQRYTDFMVIVLFFAILSLGLLFISDEFTNSWNSILNNTHATIISWRTSILFVFIFDIILITILVIKTGGSKNSAFAPMYFLLPTLALLLREPLSHLLTYAILIFVAFSACITMDSILAYRDSSQQKLAYWTVSVLSFILTLFIGYKTRPVY